MEIIRLGDRGVVSITGADAATLLQGLVTCDISNAEQSGIAYGALLTPQGKLLFDFMLHKTDRGFVADLPIDVVEDFIKRMKLYRLRAKVDLEDYSDRLAVFQIFDDDAMGRPDPRHAQLGRRIVAAPEEIEAHPAASRAVALDVYHSKRIALGVPEAPHDFTYGHVFPHDIALDSLGGVSFQKGCFVGQEVVSRMEHRGTARRRIVHVTSDEALPAPGTDIVAGDKQIGALGSHTDRIGIAIVRLDRARAARSDGEEVRCGGAPVSLSIPDWASYTWPETIPDPAG